MTDPYSPEELARKFATRDEDVTPEVHELVKRMNRDEAEKVANGNVNPNRRFPDDDSFIAYHTGRIDSINQPDDNQPPEGDTTND